ncbi:hypothetical protein GGX14DRAFT_617852 [Mycena pura]|uniref:Uncharacterized protein n=1 Tax=Mycena pura TaxID=153505 RepID=A0AAD6YHG9_9AGAR|nr:hypothetical protein GGX14DRAFT_617852 [Mycena pura]
MCTPIESNNVENQNIPKAAPPSVVRLFGHTSRDRDLDEPPGVLAQLRVAAHVRPQYLNKNSVSELFQSLPSEFFHGLSPPVEAPKAHSAGGFRPNSPGLGPTPRQRAEPFLAFEGDADAIDSVLSAIDENSLPFSCRIFARTPNSVTFRIMPQRIHEYCTAMLAQEIDYVARQIFQSVWLSNVLPSGSVEVQLPTKHKQGSASWTPEDRRAPTVVLEVGTAENLSALQGDMWTWFAKGSETRFVLLVAVHDKHTPLSITVQGYVRAGDPQVCVQDPGPVMIYEAQWNGDWTVTQPLSIPLQFFLPNDFQFPDENPLRENMDPQVELGVVYHGQWYIVKRVKRVAPDRSADMS